MKNSWSGVLTNYTDYASIGLGGRQMTIKLIDRILLSGLAVITLLVLMRFSIGIATLWCELPLALVVATEVGFLALRGAKR